METIKAFFATAKLYLLGALLVSFGVAYWWHGHGQFKAGRHAGDAEVAQMKAAYVKGANEADANARAQQQAIDEAQNAAAFMHEMQVQRQLVQLTQELDAAQRSANTFKAKVDELKKRDPAVRKWADEPVPASVRAAGTGAAQ
jgi:hypothetical protein